MWFLVEGIELDALRVGKDADKTIAGVLCRILALKNENIINCLIKSKSIDSRRSKPQLVYSLFVESVIDLAKCRTSLKITPVSLTEVNKKYSPELDITHNVSTKSPVIVIGTGPAGIFAALALARAKFKVIILDRGKKVDARQQDWEKFIKTRELDEESNLLIGEGGAGTFSDGKLFTRTKDEDSNFVLKTFVEHGASPDTLYLKRPHIGSDILPRVAASMRLEIESLGGEFRFSTQVKSLIIENDTVTGVETADGEKI